MFLGVPVLLSQSRTIRVQHRATFETFQATSASFQVAGMHRATCGHLAISGMKQPSSGPVKWWGEKRVGGQME